MKYKSPEELFDEFYKWAEIPEDFELWDFVELKKYAPESARNAFREYLRRIFRHAISDDRFITEDKKIVGFVDGLGAEEKRQCEICMKLIAEGWYKNEP